ncbi:hypothetical protein Egran_04567 [Elaphomyces granulatus]|uniref:Uncharacterized protein n=1 Tax=Elaphomyces granulatus TaxID=519963 RepID=A0A232LV08_9EURO|nr:hypothetical protein Egran_04567 [Elaphomyces granulatus]
MTSTSARPGTLVESSGYMRSNDALKWKDIELYMVKHPEDPACEVLLMRVLTVQSPVFTYTERNDNLGLCVIQDVLEYAFLDNAFASERIKEPRDIWRYTNVPEHRLSTPIHFKKSVHNIPVFRRAVRNTEGNWVSDPISLYKYRKGAAANLRNLDEHSHDTQSIFMETPTRDALAKLSSNASLTRDASAPQDLTTPQKKELEKNPELMKLKQKCDTGPIPEINPSALGYYLTTRLWPAVTSIFEHKAPRYETPTDDTGTWFDLLVSAFLAAILTGMSVMSSPIVLLQLYGTTSIRYERACVGC